MRALLPAVLMLAALPAHADWHEASTRHFVVYADQNPERLKAYAAELERFDNTMRTLIAAPNEPVGKANRVTVFVVDDTDDVVGLLKRRNVGGFYIPRAGAAFAVVPRQPQGGQFGMSAQHVLQHEYSHHLMWSLSPHAVYPAWYREGFAEVFGTMDFRDDGKIAVGKVPQMRAGGLLAGNALPIEKMLTADTRRLNQLQRQGLYGRGWLLTHYFMLQGARPGQLNAYLDALNAGKPPLEAAKPFGDLDKLDGELERYKRGTLKVRLLPADGAAVAVEMRKLTAGEAATMDVRIRSRVRSTPAVFQDAIKAVAPYPDDAAAQGVVAASAYWAKDYPAAEAAADRGIAADPKAADALLYKAMAKLARARAARDRSPETLAAVRKAIGAANRLDPDDPRPLILYFRSYTDFGQAPTDMAKKGLLRAFDLAPFDKATRFAAARVLLRDGGKAEARSLLAERASALIALIDAGDSEGAAKALEDDADKQDGDDAA
jgi:tetratricopeptide (TPR) repeat protein